jgi:NitT/TauT family transport system ATP-binding protein
MGTRVSRIRFENVSKLFPRGNGAVAALEEVSFDVADQEFVTIVGPSGCGKTTLMRMVAGLETPTLGSVLVGDRPVRGPGPDRAVVFQQFALFPWKTVGENIAFGLKSKGVSRRKQIELIAHYLKLMKLKGTETSYPHQLSGGMQQRVAIARSYAIEPEVLLMDEPFGALDAQTRTIMQEELIRITAANPRTVLFITHSVEEAVYLADRIVVLSRHPGRVREIIDVNAVRERDGWSARAIEEVMEAPSFTHLRAHVWKLLREQMGAANE